MYIYGTYYYKNTLLLFFGILTTHPTYFDFILSLFIFILFHLHTKFNKHRYLVKVKGKKIIQTNIKSYKYNTVFKLVYEEKTLDILVGGDIAVRTIIFSL